MAIERRSYVSNEAKKIAAEYYPGDLVAREAENLSFNLRTEAARKEKKLLDSVRPTNLNDALGEFSNVLHPESLEGNFKFEMDAKIYEMIHGYVNDEKTEVLMVGQWLDDKSWKIEKYILFSSHDNVVDLVSLFPGFGVKEIVMSLRDPKITTDKGVNFITHGQYFAQERKIALYEFN